MVTLSPQGRAVAAIVLAFTLLTGSLGRVGNAVLAVFDLDYDGRGSLTVAALTMLAIAVAVLLFSRSVAVQEGWAGALAQAAVLISALGVVIQALILFAVLVQGTQSAFGYAAFL